jgi:hypothetical protein
MIGLSKRIAFFTVLFSAFAFSACQQHETIAGLKKEPLATLLQKFDIPLTDSLDQLVRDTQVAWIRQPGKERWEVASSCEHTKEELMPLFEELGLIHAWEPKYKQYDYIVVFGAAILGVRDRMNYLQKLWQMGVRADHIILLAGQRVLDVAHEIPLLVEEQAPLDSLKTETDIMRFEFQKLELKDCQNVHVVVIDTPQQITQSGSFRRPNTADTVIEWFKQEHPKPGTCLLISSQPFCSYQDTVFKTLLSNGFPVETVGSSDNGNKAIEVYFDTIARTLYQYKTGKSVV